MNNDEKNNFLKKLREKAQKRNQKAFPAPENLSLEEIRQVYEEMGIYQAELEIQNEELQETAEKLERSRELLFNLFHDSPIPFAIINQKGWIEQVNRAFCDFFGTKAKEVYQKPFQSFLNKSDQSVFLSYLKSLFAHPENHTLILRTRKPEDRTCWVELKARAVAWDDDGASSKPTPKLLISLQDITAQKQIQEFLTRDRQRLQSLLDILQRAESHPADLIPELLKQALLMTNSRMAYWLETEPPNRLLRLLWHAETDLQDWLVHPHQQMLEWKDDDLWTQPIVQQKPLFWNDLNVQPPLSEKNWAERLHRILIVPVDTDGQFPSLLAVANKSEPYDEIDSNHLQILLKNGFQALKKRLLEDKLAEQERLYRELIENSDDLIYRISLLPQPKIDYISPSVQTLTGYTVEELLSNPQIVYQLIYPDDLPKLNQILERNLDNSQPLVGRFLHRNGEVRWSEQRITWLYDQTGQRTGIQGIIRDVTARKTLELAIERMVEEYNILFDSVQDALFLIKVEDDGEFRYIRNNRIHQELTGIPLEVLRGKTPKELLGSELGAVVQANYQSCIDAGEIIQYEETLDLPGGTRYWFTTLIPVYHGDRIAYIVGDARDITVLKETEEKQRVTEMLFKKLFENMHEGFCIWEVIHESKTHRMDFRLAEINPAGLRLLNLPYHEAVGAQLSQVKWTIIPPKDDLLAQSFLEKRPVNGEIFIKELGKYWVIMIYPLSKNLLAEIFVDITDRKKMEMERERMIADLKAKNNELENFTYSVSHDLKSPLITIRTFLDFVEESLNSNDLETALQDLQRIRQAATKMSGLLDGILELSRIGRRLNLLMEINLEEVIREAIENLSGKLEQHYPPIQITICDHFPTLMGDHLRLVEVFQNLIDNAIKYMGAQPNPQIEIGWEDHDQEIWIYVRDNGIGIEPRKIDKIFNLFEKLDENSSGYGIGLSIVQRIIETHHGRVWAFSDGINQGSTFWISLPLFPKPDYPLSEDLHD